MSDIALSFDGANARADWTITAGQVVTGSDLQTAVLVSLFTDRVLDPDQTPPDGSDDRRGWWADTYRDQPLGSLLWTLERAVKSDSARLLAYAQKACIDALQWLVDDGVAATVRVQTNWLTPTEIGIVVTITEPTGTISTFQYAYAWQGVN